MALSRDHPRHADLEVGDLPSGDDRAWPDEPRPRHGRLRGLRGRFAEQPVLNGLLLALCVAAIVIAVTAIGPASQSSGQTTRTSTVKRGVVQSTVSGSGNVQSADQLDLGFKTSGTVTNIYVKQGQHVTRGQLLATLDPQTTEVTLEQAKASLKSEEATLAQLEENGGETSSGQGGSGANSEAASAASTSDVSYATDVYAQAASAAPSEKDGSPPGAGTTPSPTTSTPTTTTTTPTNTSTATTTTSPTTTTSSPTTTPKTTTTPATKKTQSGSAESTKAADSSGATPTSTKSSDSKESAATREANLASARAAVKSDKLTVQSDEKAVQNTKLYAPESGTIVSLSGEVGQDVSATGTTKASSSSSSSSSSSASKTGAAGASTAASPSSSEGSSGSSSSSAFMVLSDLESMQLVVALSESEIGNVHVGQIATVTLEALDGRKVAAHVVNVNQVPTSSSGAVSYDVTFQLDQGAEGLKVGMSATAEVVVKEAEGLNVPTSAIKAGSVTVDRNGKQVAQPVTTGLAGNSSTIILSGLNVGETVVLPTASSSTGSSSSLFGSRGSSKSTLGGTLGGIGGGDFPGGGGGFPGGGPP